jgi:hypothetical protein
LASLTPTGSAEPSRAVFRTVDGARLADSSNAGFVRVENAVRVEEVIASSCLHRQGPETRRVGLMTQVTGHVLASLLGVAIGYYVLCCVRPAEYNWWGLPIPGSSSAMSAAEQ